MIKDKVTCHVKGHIEERQRIIKLIDGKIGELEKKYQFNTDDGIIGGELEVLTELKGLLDTDKDYRPLVTSERGRCTMTNKELDSVQNQRGCLDSEISIQHPMTSEISKGKKEIDKE